MARFKRKAKRRSFGGFKRRSHKRGGSSDNLMTTMVAAAAYGAVRPKIETVIAPYTAKIPLGGYADEVALGAVGYILAKGKMPMLKGKTARSVGKAMLIIESARVGSGLSSQFM